MQIGFMGISLTLPPRPGSSVGAPAPETFRILTEDGGVLVTESGDPIKTEE